MSVKRHDTAGKSPSVRCYKYKFGGAYFILTRPWATWSSQKCPNVVQYTIILSVNFSWIKYSMVYSRPNIYLKMFHNLFILLEKTSESYVFTYILENKILPLVLKYVGYKFNMCNYFLPQRTETYIYFFMFYLYFNFLYKDQSS